MLSRGYTGTMPALGATAASRATWGRAIVPAVAAVLFAASGYWMS
jgi:hypothetical protein